MPTPEEIAEGVRLFQAELIRDADKIAAILESPEPAPAPKPKRRPREISSEPRPTLSPAEYRKARALWERADFDKLHIARALDAHDRAVRELRAFLEADAEGKR